jgi:hypothetical protein
MTSPFPFHYGVMSSAIADQHAAELTNGIRTSLDGSTVIAKLTVGQNIDGASSMALPSLFTYIESTPALWADPTL